MPYAVPSCGVEVFGVDKLGQLYMAVRGITSGVKKENKRVKTEFEPMTSAMPVQCSTN